MSGPYEKLHIYEVDGILDEIPHAWRERGFLGCWEEAGYTFLFFSMPSRELVEECLAGLGSLRLRSETVIPYEDWEAGTKLRPLRVGPLHIAPPWDAGEVAEAIIIDPGVSFGSGFHGSTRACLELLVRLYELDEPKRVLDLGTGSGILALAAARLGALSVVAVDTQPVAVEAARGNVARNLMEGSVEVKSGDALEWVSAPADLVMGNLYLDLLLELVSRPVLWNRRWCILAGVIGRQADRLLEALRSTPMKLVKSWREGLWSAFLLKGEHSGVGKGGSSSSGLSCRTEREGIGSEK